MQRRTLASVKASKFYVPLAPSHPEVRLLYGLEDSQARLVITNNRNATITGLDDTSIEAAHVQVLAEQLRACIDSTLHEYAMHLCTQH